MALRALLSSVLPKCLQSTKACFCSSTSLRSEALQVAQMANKLSPIISFNKFEIVRTVVDPRQAWVETLDRNELCRYAGFMNLHPDIFASYPRMDIIHENIVWQYKYRFVNRRHAPVKHEINRTGRKPWPQKGQGKARHRNKRGPLWKGGGVSHPPRVFTTMFYMLPFNKRIKGLVSALSAKFAQDDLKIIDSLEMASDDPKYLEELASERFWGPSILFVDDSDIMPRNITMATDTLGHMNLMPVYGLNVHSLLKYETVVLTMAAVRRIEERLIYQMNRPDAASCCQMYTNCR